MKKPLFYVYFSWGVEDISAVMLSICFLHSFHMYFFIFGVCRWLVFNSIIAQGSVRNGSFFNATLITDVRDTFIRCSPSTPISTCLYLLALSQKLIGVYAKPSHPPLQVLHGMCARTLSPIQYFYETRHHSGIL